MISDLKNTLKVDLGFAILAVKQHYHPDCKGVFVFLEDRNGVWLQDVAEIIGAIEVDEDSDELANRPLEALSINIFEDVYSSEASHQITIGLADPNSEEHASTESNYRRIEQIFEE